MVCADGAIAEVDVLDLVGSLVDKSLVQADVARDEMRYRLLESMRAYAREKLIRHGELESMTRAHAGAYLKLAEKLESAWQTTPDREWKVQAEPELENWRVALSWAFRTDGDVRLGQRLVVALAPTWYAMAPSEGRRWIQAGLDRLDDAAPKEIAAKLDLCEAHLAMLTQQYKAALPQAERASELFGELDDPQGKALANMFMGAGRGLQGEIAEGTALLQDSLQQFRRSDSRRAIGAALNYLGLLQLASGNVAASRSFFSEALGFLRAVGAARPAAHVALYLAEAEFQAGDSTKAVELVSDALATERALNEVDGVTFEVESEVERRALDGVMFAQLNLSAYLVSLGSWDDATLHAREALSRGLGTKTTAATIWALQHLAAISALRPREIDADETRDRRRAARLIGFVDARLAELSLRRDFTEQKEYERASTAIEEALGAEAAVLMEEGRHWNETRVADEALLI